MQKKKYFLQDINGLFTKFYGAVIFWQKQK